MNALPRWRGFNLIELYSAGKGAPYRSDDFHWIADWGFDFVRLPLSYTHWIAGSDPFQIAEGCAAFDWLDQAVEWARRDNLHLCLNLHRAPGYCVNQERQEPFHLWRDASALEAFCLHWQTLAQRYAGVPSTRLSFDLLNEPPPEARWDRFLPWNRRNQVTRRRHAEVMRAAVAAIRQADPDRLIILDGLNYGRQPCPELADLPNVAQSCRAYEPFALSHYRAEWMPFSGKWRLPAWPMSRAVGLGGRRWNRARLEAVYAPWATLLAQGVGVHCGEAGCYQHTPHAVFLAWFEDVLSVLQGHGIGWALWNFRGPFGVLDTNRTDVVYEDWHGGHQLDRALLTLLQAH